MTTQEFDKAVKAFVLAYRTGPEASISNGQVATKREDDDDWVTIKGTHVLLNENGEAQGGGNLKGMTFSKAKTQNGGAEEKHESAFKTKGEYKPGNTFTEWQRANMVGRDNPTRKALSNIFKEEGIEGVMKEYYSSRTASSTKDLHHISDSEADEILYDHMPQNVFTGWFRDANSEYKPRVVNAVTASPEARNASLSIMYDNYRELTGGKMGYEEFLNTPVQMYRGGHGQEHTNDDIFSSFSFDRGVAEKFAGENGTVYEAKIRPIDTWGSVTTNKESEIMVPSWITPNKHKDGKFDSAYDEWLEENLDKFESDDEELEFAKWKNKDGIKARDCNDVDTVDSMWKEYKTKRGDSNDSKKSKVGLSGAKDFFNTLLAFGNKYISKKIIDIASKSDIIKIEGNITHTDADVDSWITLENGEHVPLNNSGEAVGGAGGWAKGKDFSDAKSSEPEKGTKEKPSANGWNVPCKGFRDDASARRHEKHWPEFGFKSREEYEKAGIRFISQPVGGDIDGYLRYKNGVAQIIRFNRKTGEMGIGVPGREMITYYKAKCNKNGVVNLESANNYFNKLKEREAA